MKNKVSLWYQICSLGTKPNIPSQIYWTKFTKPYPQNCIYKIKSTNQNVSNVKSQIYWTKHTKPNLFNETCKLNPPNQFYQTKSRENKSTENQSEVQSQLVLRMAKLSPSLLIICCWKWDEMPHQFRAALPTQEIFMTSQTLPPSANYFFTFYRFYRQPYIFTIISYIASYPPPSISV